jgi:hypothetical protein
MTVTVVLLDITEARRLTERIRRDLDRVASGWADLAAHIAEAYERRADLALGYDSWEAYASAELKPSEGIAAEVRRELVGLLSARGMSTRAIAPTVGVTQRQISTDVRSNFSPERINPITGEIVPAPTFGAVDVTDWTNDEITEDLEACEAETAHWEETTVPAPKITGLDGKTYTRPTPQPKETPVTTASRLAMPQPPKYGGNRLKHNRIIENVALAGRGMCTVLDEITELDQSITNEEAGRLASDLSEVIRSLKRIQTMLNRKATS